MSEKPPIFESSEPSFEIPEKDFEHLADFLNSQRPRGEADEQQRNIDWWHFTAYAQELSEVDLERLDECILASDSDSARQDFERLRESDEDEKRWSLPIYATRLKDLGWHEYQFSDSEWQQIEAEVESLRAAGKWWHLVYYLGHIAQLDVAKAQSMMIETDWHKLEQALKVVEAPNPDARALGAITMANHLQELAGDRELDFEIEEYVTEALHRVPELKKRDDWRYVLNYYAEIVKARQAT